MLSVSLEAQAARAGVQAADGRVLATRPWLPTTPALSLSGARRSSAGESDVNWTASLGVELEVAGQRGARREAATAEREGQLKARRKPALAPPAFAAWQTYFDALAAVEAAQLTARLEAGAKRVADTARARRRTGRAFGCRIRPGRCLLRAAGAATNRRRARGRGVARRAGRTTRPRIHSRIGHSRYADPVARRRERRHRSGRAAGRGRARSREPRVRGACPEPSAVVACPIRPCPCSRSATDSTNECWASASRYRAIARAVGAHACGEIAENEALSRRAHFLPRTRGVRAERGACARWRATRPPNARPPFIPPSVCSARRRRSPASRPRSKPGA